VTSSEATRPIFESMPAAFLLLCCMSSRSKQEFSESYQ